MNSSASQSTKQRRANTRISFPWARNKRIQQEQAVVHESFRSARERERTTGHRPNSTFDVAELASNSTVARFSPSNASKKNHVADGSLPPPPSNCYKEEQRDVCRVEQPQERGIVDAAGARGPPITNRRCLEFASLRSLKAAAQLPMLLPIASVCSSSPNCFKEGQWELDSVAAGVSHRTAQSVDAAGLPEFLCISRRRPRSSYVVAFAGVGSLPDCVFRRCWIACRGSMSVLLSRHRK
nr:hypothetical protein Iba_chr13dCG5740 [Ipomoea batatas]